jgi:hypothetical protein
MGLADCVKDSVQDLAALLRELGRDRERLARLRERASAVALRSLADAAADVLDCYGTEWRQPVENADLRRAFLAYWDYQLSCAACKPIPDIEAGYPAPWYPVYQAVRNWLPNPVRTAVRTWILSHKSEWTAQVPLHTLAYEPGSVSVETAGNQVRLMLPERHAAVVIPGGSLPERTPDYLCSA